MTNHDNINITQFTLDMKWGAFCAKAPSDDIRGKILVYLCLNMLYSDEIANSKVQIPTVTVSHGGADVGFLGTKVNAKISRCNFCCTRTDKTGFNFSRTSFSNEPVTIGFCLPDISQSDVDDRETKCQQLIDAGFELVDNADTVRLVIEKSRVVMYTAAMERFKGRFFDTNVQMFFPLTRSSRTRDELWNMIVKERSQVPFRVVCIKDYFDEVLTFMKNPPSRPAVDAAGQAAAVAAILEVARAQNLSAEAIDDVVKKVKRELRDDVKKAKKPKTEVQSSSTASTSVKRVAEDIDENSPAL